MTLNVGYLLSMDCVEVRNEDEPQAGRKLLVGSEDWSGHTFCHVVEWKGLGDSHIVAKSFEVSADDGKDEDELEN